MDWNEHAGGWDDDPAVRTYAAATFETIAAQLQRLARSLSDLRVLDFGCGTGVLTESLAPACREVVALDPAAKMIEVLRAKITNNGWSNVRAINATLADARSHEADPLTPPFDLVVCSSVCAFVPDYPATVRELAAVLGKGGIFMQFDWERDDSDEEPFGLTAAEIGAALEAAGLTERIVGTAFERPMGEMTMKPLLGLGLRG